MEKWLTYDQISLIPTQVSTLEHRAEADTTVRFGPILLAVPIIAAPMPDVSNGAMAEALRNRGSFGWVHRFQTELEQFEQLSLNRNDPFWDAKWMGAAVSPNDHERRVRDFLYPAGVRIFCLDTANGASVAVQRALGNLKDKYPDIFIVAGNVASGEAFKKLEEWGADAIRVGIAGGSVCETRTETGVYSPTATVVKECAGPFGPVTTYRPVTYAPYTWSRWQSKEITISQEVITWRHKKALLIADGGIRTPADMCKALALGADVVMMGGALAGTKESPGPVIMIDGKKYKRLAGAASYVTQKESNGEEPNYVEGAETLVPYTGSVEKVIGRFAAGLRSSMSYMNATDLTNFRKNVKIVEIS